MAFRWRRKVSGQAKATVIDKLRDLHTQLDKGVTQGRLRPLQRPASHAGLARARLDGRSAKTITKNQNVLATIVTVIGARKLRDLTAADVRQALATMAAGYSSAAVTMGHLALKRAIRHAEANDLVARNVAALADTPKGQDGRPSKSLTTDQAAAVITTARTLPVMELRPALKDVHRPAALMHLGAALDASNVRKMFKRIGTEAGIGNGWTPPELRTTFVSLLSHRGSASRRSPGSPGTPPPAPPRSSAAGNCGR